MKKGAVVRWRGGSYRIERVYLTQVRIQSLEYPAIFRLVGECELEVVR
jgi:hypothetical protein